MRQIIYTMSDGWSGKAWLRNRGLRETRNKLQRQLGEGDSSKEGNSQPGLFQGQGQAGGQSGCGRVTKEESGMKEGH